MQFSDRMTGVFLALLGAVAPYRGSLQPTVPGQDMGPGVFPMVIGAGLVVGSLPGLSAAMATALLAPVADGPALREMIAFICGRSDLSREQAYAFCSLAVDFRVTQSVNGDKGMHGMLRKGVLF